MSETERRYAQVEKEALAITWACEKFADFIIGKQIESETDHKPLVSLLGSKHLNNLPPRILRFRLRLDRFSYSIKHVPGKELYTADTLSQTPVSKPTAESDATLEELADIFMLETISHLPASSPTLQKYRQAQKNDPACQQVISYCKTGWPSKGEVSPMCKTILGFSGRIDSGR